MSASSSQLSLDLAPAPPASAAQPGALPLPPVVVQLIGFLSLRCRGPRRAATAGQLAEWLGLETRDAAREVRELISLYYPQFPFVVCGSGGAGFFVAEAPDEVTHEYRSLYSRLHCLARRLSSLNRVAARSGFERLSSGPGAAFQWHLNPADVTHCQPTENGHSSPSGPVAVKSSELAF